MRRQIEAAKRFARTLKMPLDDRPYADEGVSGRKLRNVSHGALGEFLRQIRAGMIAPGSILIVERLNRLTRSEPLAAFGLLHEIISAGVEVITMENKRRYNASSMREVSHLIEVLILMNGAWQESEDKSEWLADAWAKKREAAGTSRTPMTRQVPAWLRVVGVREIGNRFDWSEAKFEVIPERASLIRDIFKKRASGWGRRRIARWLNDSGVQVWGRGKRMARGGWQESYITKILSSRAVLGEYQPHKLKDGRYSERIPVGKPISDYYPAIVTKALWCRAQTEVTCGRPIARGRPSRRNPFSGMLADPTGAPMHLVRKGEGCDYLMTARAFTKTGVKAYAWRLDNFILVMEMFIRRLDWRRVLGTEESESKTRELRDRLLEKQRERSQLKQEIDLAAKRALEPGMGVLAGSILEIANELTERDGRIKAEITSIEAELSRVETAERTELVNDVNLTELMSKAGDPAALVRLQREIRALVKKVILYPTGEVPGTPYQIYQRTAANMLTGTRGIVAKKHSRVCGAIRVQFVNGMEITVWVPYRPGDRVKEPPTVIGVLPSDESSDAWRSVARDLAGESLLHASEAVRRRPQRRG